VDLFLYDLKLIEDTRHRQWTGVSNELILSNLRQLLETGQRIIIRIPIIPGINDDDENLQQTGEFLKALPHKPAVELLPYHNIAEGKYTGLGREYVLSEIHSPTPEQMEEFISKMHAYGLQVYP
jgi:pyruvate formate lyase activating enzyme